MLNFTSSSMITSTPIIQMYWEVNFTNLGRFPILQRISVCIFIFYTILEYYIFILWCNKYKKIKLKSHIISYQIKEKSRCLACSNSCLSLCSCDSSCLLWSSRICILASRRPLCWRSNFASAMSSASRGLCGEMGIISGGDGSGDSPLWSCCCFSRSYSACRFLLKE